MVVNCFNGFHVKRILQSLGVNPHLSCSTRLCSLPPSSFSSFFCSPIFVIYFLVTFSHKSWPLTTDHFAGLHLNCLSFNNFCLLFFPRLSLIDHPLTALFLLSQVAPAHLPPSPARRTRPSRAHFASPGPWRPRRPWSPWRWCARSARCSTPTAASTSCASATCCCACRATRPAMTSSSGRWRCASSRGSPSMACASNGSRARPLPSRTLPQRLPTSSNCECGGGARRDEIKGWRWVSEGGDGTEEDDAVSGVGSLWRSGGKLKGGITLKITWLLWTKVWSRAIRSLRLENVSFLEVLFLKFPRLWCPLSCEVLIDRGLLFPDGFYFFVTFYLDVPLFCMSDLLSLFFRSHTLITLTTPVTSSCYLFSFSARFCCQVFLGWGKPGRNGGWMENKESRGTADLKKTQKNDKKTTFYFLSESLTSGDEWPKARSLTLLENSKGVLIWICSDSPPKLMDSNWARTLVAEANCHTHARTHAHTDGLWMDELCCCWFKDPLRPPHARTNPSCPETNFRNPPDSSFHHIPPLTHTHTHTHSHFTTLSLLFQTELGTSTSIFSASSLLFLPHL